MIKKIILGLTLLFSTFGVVGSYIYYGLDNVKYFTNQSNLLVLVVMILYVFKKKFKYFNHLAIIALFDIIVTGVIYNALLREFQTNMAPMALTLVFVNHTINPLLYLVTYSLYFKKPFMIKDFYMMLIHPMLYFLFYMIFGRLLNYFPYPFIDPRGQSGLQFFVTNFVILLPLMIVLSIGLIQLTRIKRITNQRV